MMNTLLETSSMFQPIKSMTPKPSSPDTVDYRFSPILSFSQYMESEIKLFIRRLFRLKSLKPKTPLIPNFLEDFLDKCQEQPVEKIMNLIRLSKKYIKLENDITKNAEECDELLLILHALQLSDAQRILIATHLIKEGEDRQHIIEVLQKPAASIHQALSAYSDNESVILNQPENFRLWLVSLYDKEDCCEYIRIFQQSFDHDPAFLASVREDFHDQLTELQMDRTSLETRLLDLQNEFQENQSELNTFFTTEEGGYSLTGYQLKRRV